MTRTRTYTNRNSFPFISSTGELSPVSDAISDMVVWTTDDVVLPFKVNFSVIDGVLEIKLVDSSYNVTLTCDERSCYLRDDINRICGIISWNPSSAVALRASIIGNDNPHYFDIYVHPSVCIPRRPSPLSSVRINGEYVDGYKIDIKIDESSGLHIFQDKDTSENFINMYSKEQINSTPVINSIKVINGEDDSNNEYEVSGDVWLKAAPECDIRVVTTDVLTVTEISNDRI